MAPDRIDLVERDVRTHAEIITKFTGELQSIKQDAAVRAVKDEYLDERLDRMEKRIDAIHSLGKWVLGTFGTSLIALIVNVLIKGGVHLGP